MTKKQESVDKRKSEILQAREELDEKGQHAKDAALKMEQAAQETAVQLSILEEISGNVIKGKGAGTSSDASSCTAQMEKIKDSIEANLNAVNLLERQAAEAEQQVVELSRKILDIDSKLPSLNEQKSLAVSSRNFKEAKRVSEQIKELSAEKAERETANGKAKEELQKFNEMIEEKKANTSKLEAEVKEMQDGVDQTLLKELMDERASLDATMARVKESGSTEDGTFGETVLFILQAEMEACLQQAREISIKIVGDDSLANLSSGGEEQDDVCSTSAEHQEEIEAVRPDADEPTQEADADAEHENQVDPEELRAKISTLDADVEKAIEIEDYDLADQLEQELKVLRQQLDACETHQASSPPVEEAEDDQANDAQVNEQHDVANSQDQQEEEEQDEDDPLG